MMHGQGTHAGADGSVYVGSYADHMRQGFGRLSYSNGDLYEGEWNQDNKHGSGTFFWLALNATYEGEFREGVVDGAGTCKFGDGSLYSGQYKDARRHGRGTFTHPDGRVEISRWEAGKRVGKESTPNGAPVSSRRAAVASASRQQQATAPNAPQPNGSQRGGAPSIPTSASSQYWSPGAANANQIPKMGQTWAPGSGF